MSAELEAVLGGWLLPGARREKRPRVVAIGGDGVGPEVTDAAVRCLLATGAAVDVVRPLHGQAALDALGTAFPPSLKEECRAADAILFGAAGGVSNEILRFIRFELETYANLRPATWLPGVRARIGGPRTDLVVVRELTEGMYPAREGDLSELQRRWPELRDRLGRPLPGAGKFAIRVVTPAAIERLARYAGALALHRAQLKGRPPKVTVVTKANVLPATDGVVLDVCKRELGQLGLQFQHLYVDEAARRMVADPDGLDVVVTTNLFGDIISDVSAEVMGGLPLSPSAGIGERHAYFEPVHGSAPDIAGRGVANPAAAILSAAMLASWLGLRSEGAALLRAVVACVGDGVRTADLGGSASSAQFTDAVLGRLGAR